jgi:integrase
VAGRSHGHLRRAQKTAEESLAHGRSQADAVLAIVRGIFNWYTANLSEHYISPVVAQMKRDKRDAKDRQRSRILNDDEIRAVWQASNDLGAFGVIVKLALLTGQRRQKIATIIWADLKEGVWTIPTEDREKGTGRNLKLPAMAVEIIETQPQLKNNNPYVFAAPPLRHFNSWGQRKKELDRELKKTLPGMAPWVIHDLRRTARSLMSRADVRPDIAERVMGHTIGGVEGIYDRHSYDQQKADALERLAALIQKIINPPQGNVVAMRKHP